MGGSECLAGLGPVHHGIDTSVGHADALGHGTHSKSVRVDKHRIECYAPRLFGRLVLWCVPIATYFAQLVL